MAEAPGPASPSSFSPKEAPSLQQPSSFQLLPNTKEVLFIFPQKFLLSNMFLLCIFLPSNFLRGENIQGDHKVPPQPIYTRDSSEPPRFHVRPCDKPKWNETPLDGSQQAIRGEHSFSNTQCKKRWPSCL